MEREYRRTGERAAQAPDEPIPQTDSLSPILDEKQDTLGLGAVIDEASGALDQSSRLTGRGPTHELDRPDSEVGGAFLLGIERRWSFRHLHEDSGGV
jgi:hypothetical protein